MAGRKVEAEAEEHCKADFEMREDGEESMDPWAVGPGVEYCCSYCCGLAPEQEKPGARTNSDRWPRDGTRICTDCSERGNEEESHRLVGDVEGFDDTQAHTQSFGGTMIVGGDGTGRKRSVTDSVGAKE